MSLLAVRTRAWPNGPMANTRDSEALDRARKGAALKALRMALGHTQESAAAAHGVTPQAWQHFEAGRRHLSEQKLAALVKSIGGTPARLELELSKIPADGPSRQLRPPKPAERVARPYDLPLAGVARGGPLEPATFDGGAEIIDLSRFFAPDTQIVRLDGMSMYPYAEPGGFVTYNPRQPARRGHGCVVVRRDGSKIVARFEGFEGEAVVVTELWPEERRLTFEAASVSGVYAIGLRGD